MINLIIFLIISLNLVFVKSNINNDKEKIIYSKSLNIEKNSNVKDYYYNDYENDYENNNEKIDYDYSEFEFNDKKYENEMKMLNITTCKCPCKHAKTNKLHTTKFYENECFKDEKFIENETFTCLFMISCKSGNFFRGNLDNDDYKSTTFKSILFIVFSVICTLLLFALIFSISIYKINFHFKHIL
jgi:hypothetical protein